eukprot:Plantae.Rhodophyta-Rhodochaete_pulchella.ctg50551.p1 GENE.Plantae.Rhodophyta-Rhodochaete_pulchella.ctg50551~~Plantae.Rhodophyta-Rhodochaete_pulchella.ctg50551.p1  ORF type:complete len:480 (-),score=35.25 Plantae.Rhodophyta-Rhodochaete_pulchella.ctg50551:199-1638(-)
MSYNYGDSLCFNDLDTSSVEPSFSIKLRSTASTHDICSRGEGTGNLRALVGCVSGEVYCFSDVPIAQILFRGGVGFNSQSACQAFNADSQISSSRVIMVRWLPGSTSRFMVVHIDGVIVIYDIRYKTSSRTRSDAEDQTKTSSTNDTGGGTSRHGLGMPPNGLQSNGNGTAEASPSEVLIRGLGAKKHHNVAGELAVWKQTKGRKANPVSIVRLSCGGVNGASLCPGTPDGSANVIVAVACKDGYVRVVDLTNEAILVSFRSYYGAMLCVSWSPDGRFLATGGEDDLVSIFCPEEHRIVVRCEGHSSWVSAVAWDGGLCKEGQYRLGSAGQDAKMLLWDFAQETLTLRSSSRLAKARAETQQAPQGTSKTRRFGRGMRLSSNASSESSAGAHTRTPSGDVNPMPVVVPAASRAEVPILEPIVSHLVHNEPLTDMVFLEEGVLTACSYGIVKLWARPQQSSIPPLVLSAQPQPRPPASTK